MPGAVENMKAGGESMLNITHTETIADTTPYAISQMQRQVLLDVEGIPVFWVASPEDTILQKLRWGKVSQSEEQWRDVLGILKLRALSLDNDYLKKWAEQLDLVEILTRALGEAGVNDS
jgi:predicted nucleotidyltransferase